MVCYGPADCEFLIRRRTTKDGFAVLTSTTKSRAFRIYCLWNELLVQTLRYTRGMGFVAVLVVGSLSCPSMAWAQEAQWIWSPEYPPNRAPIGDVYFRKVVQVSEIEQAKITVVADDSFQLFINGRTVGGPQKSLDQMDISRLMVRGRNAIAIKATNRAGATAGLAVQLHVKQVNQNWRVVASDASWKTTLDATPNWQSLTFNDARWVQSRVLGRYRGNEQGADQPQATGQNVASGQFLVPSGFSVEKMVDEELCGSVIAMAFNEFGHLIVSQEDGPLTLIYDSDKDGKPDKARTYCEAVKNIQGILPLNGDVYVTGDTEEGSGVFRLVDSDRNGTLDEVTRLVAFKTTSAEHGPHQLSLGPDGMIYVIVGNHSQLVEKASPDSPYTVVYEGDLVQPRFEDPGGHARGVKAPGGTIVRMDLTGEHVEVVAGGIRNAYDLAFHSSGAMLVHDSDMEADVGTTWYRPTSLFDVSPGAELGWRSGWAQWPEYYVDRIPTLLETGRGSPTGAVVYEHYAYPSRYHRNLFLADWSEGRILAVQLKPNGASFSAHAEVFVKGQPLNVTDLDVGSDGSLYFCTGGRGTDGGIYRVRWNGEIPKDLKDLGSGIAKAIRQPQIQSAWGRQEIALVKKELGQSWDEMVAGVAYSPDNPARYRVRALELMQLLGPVPTPDLLIDLSRSPNEAVRAKTAQLLGLQSDNQESVERLSEMLQDSDQLVRRIACESLRRCNGKCEINDLLPLLESNDRMLVFSARRLMESLPAQDWKEAALKSRKNRIQVQGVLALMGTEPTAENARQSIAKLLESMNGFVSDREFLDMLRTIQVTLACSGLRIQDVPELRTKIAEEFPAGEPLINRELIRLAVYLQAEEITDRAIAYIQSDAPMSERVHVAMHLKFLKRDWSSTERFAVMKFLEDATKSEGGSSYPLYVMDATTDLSQGMTLEEARVFVREGVQWPNAALAGLRLFPEKISHEDFEALRNVDQAIDRAGLEADYYKRLKTGITAILARSGDAESLAYLREVWRRSPDRRANVALGLAFHPEGENWDYIIRSLSVLDAFAVPDIFKQLQGVPTAPDDAEAIRQVILHGLRMQRDEENPAPALSLLSHWTGKDFASEGNPEVQLQSWQKWFRSLYPSHTEPELPKEDGNSKWSMDLLTEYLDGVKGKKGSRENGALVWTKANCNDCHKMGGKGAAVGPDLSSISRRFTRHEALESILYPSHVISDQYASQKVLTTSGEVYVGLVSKASNGLLRVLRSDLTQLTVPDEDIEEITTSKVSMMPSGLLEKLSAEEVRDLLCYMGYIPEEQVAETNRSSKTQKR